MDSLASLLAAKYGKKDKGGKRGNASQEDFLAAQQRHLKKTKNKYSWLLQIHETCHADFNFFFLDKCIGYQVRFHDLCHHSR